MYKTWFVEDSIVHAWLINLMEPRISCQYFFLKTTNDVWDIVQWMYYDLAVKIKGDEARHLVGYSVFHRLRG